MNGFCRKDLGRMVVFTEMKRSSKKSKQSKAKTSAAEEVECWGRLSASQNLLHVQVAECCPVSEFLSKF